MVLASPRSNAKGLLSIPDDMASEKQHRQRLARGIRQLQERSLLKPVAVPTTVTGNYTVSDDDELIRVDASSGAVTVTLLAAGPHEGQSVIIKKTDSSANAVTIQGPTNTIKLLQQGALREYMDDGSVWQLVRELGYSDVLGDTL